MIYLVRGNDTPLIVALGLKDDNSTIPYDLTDVDRLRLSLVGHGMHVFAKDVAVRPSANTVQGIIPGRALLNGDYGLEVTFVKDGKDKRFYVDTDGEGNPLFVVVNRIESDADDEAEGEGGGVEVTITIQPEVINFAGETGTAAGFGTVTATVDSSVGTPSVTVTTSGPNTAKNFTFAFHNLKGANGSDASVTYANVVAALGYVPVTPAELAAECDNYIALYDVTTWAEIDEAVDAGKIAFAVYGTTYYRLVGSDDNNTWTFVALSDEGLLQSLTCDTEDAWESDSFLLAKDSDLATKQDTLTFDNSPVQNSSNPVKSGGIYTALAGKQATISDLSAIRSGASAGATAYQKPNGGIPSSDMASAVRATLDKADTAYQKPGSGIPQTDLASGVQASLGKADTAYQKPGSGIPSTDMTSAVQTSLGKADSAYQKPGTGIPSTDLASAVTTSLGLANSAYQKPSGGIPSTDLASGVQTSLGKADTAYQKPSGGVPSTDMTTAVQTSLGKADTAYQKPSGGIPSTDMTTAVQTSLGKADTAVQDVSGKEDKSNKVTSISGSSTDTQYPSAKLVYDQLATKQATISTVNVTVDNNTGTPSGTASVSGSTLSLSFTNLKGAKGDTGATGATGPQGPKGDQGNTGSSVDYSYELVNNLTTNDATKGLSAAQGVVLEGEISQLGQELIDTSLDFVIGSIAISNGAEQGTTTRAKTMDYFHTTGELVFTPDLMVSCRYYNASKVFQASDQSWTTKSPYKFNRSYPYVRIVTAYLNSAVLSDADITAIEGKVKIKGLDERVEDIEEYVENELKPVYQEVENTSLNLELGTLETSDGSETSSTTRARTGYMLTKGEIAFDSDVKVSCRYYNSSKVFQLSDTGWTTESPYKFNSNYPYVRIVVAYANDATISNVSTLAGKVKIKGLAERVGDLETQVNNLTLNEGLKETLKTKKIGDFVKYPVSGYYAQIDTDYKSSEYFDTYIVPADGARFVSAHIKGNSTATAGVTCWSGPNPNTATRVKKIDNINGEQDVLFEVPSGTQQITFSSLTDTLDFTIYYDELPEVPKHTLYVDELLNSDNTGGRIVDNPTYNDRRVITKSICAFPNTGLKVKVHLPFNLRVSFRITPLAGTESVGDAFGGWVYDGAELTFPYYGVEYRIVFAPQSPDTSTTTLAASYIRNCINAGIIYFSYETNETDIITRNYNKDARVGAVKRILTGLEDGMDSMFTFGHISDIHGDAVRFANFMDYLKAKGVDAALNSGDAVMFNAYDYTSFCKNIAAQYSIPYFFCIGNHESHPTGQTTLFADNIQGLVTTYGYLKAADTPADDCYYYRDFSEKKIRLIVINYYNNGVYNGSLGQAQITWFISVLGSTPSGYGVLIMNHAAEDKVVVPSQYDAFFQKVRWTTGDRSIRNMAGQKPIMKIVDAFISRSTLSWSYADNGTTVTVEADYSGITDDTIEFIGYVTGHSHEDYIGYYENSQNKQLCLGITCGNALYGFGNNKALANQEDLPRGGEGVNQDAFNIYSIDRVHKTVKVARIGADLNFNFEPREYMAIPYADASE